jgi:prepilin-type N-terminal cleavage/methylation domain-containing protein
MPQVGKKFPSGRPRARLNRGFRRGPVLAIRKDGHTLVELAVAIAIVGIFAAIGWGEIQEQVDRYRMMKAARMLHSDIQSLRATAIADNREMRLRLVAGDSALDPSAPQIGEWQLQAGNRSLGSTTWDTLPADSPDDGEGERSLAPGGSEEAPHVSLAAWSPLTGPGTDNADSLVFSPRGWLLNPATDFDNGYVVLRIVNKAATARGGDEAVSIRVSRGGLARLEVSSSSTLPTNTVGTGEAGAP